MYDRFKWMGQRNQEFSEKPAEFPGTRSIIVAQA